MIIGVRSVNVMRRHLRGFVEKEIFAGKTKPYNNTTVKQRFSKCDQTNVSKIVEKWREQNPNDNFLFRPYADVEEFCETIGSDLDNDNVDNDDNDCNEDDEEDVKIKHALSKQKLLFAHQTEMQRHLLSRYGNDICLLNATYKTTRYALPLFFIAVRTNVDYQIVGSFVIQDESTESIMEALKIFKKWNQGWEPSYFMVDCCEEEINAIDGTFAGMSTHNYR